MATICTKTMCGNCCHSVLHLPVKDYYIQDMLCLYWSEVTTSVKTCDFFKHQNEVAFFHTWNEKTKKPNTIYYQLKDLNL